MEAHIIQSKIGLGLLFVLISGLVVYFKGESFTSLIIDPILAILSIVIFIITSYPFGRFEHRKTMASNIVF